MELQHQLKGAVHFLYDLLVYIEPFDGDFDMHKQV